LCWYFVSTGGSIMLSCGVSLTKEYILFIHTHQRKSDCNRRALLLFKCRCRGIQGATFGRIQEVSLYIRWSWEDNFMLHLRGKSPPPPHPQLVWMWWPRGKLNHRDSSPSIHFIISVTELFWYHEI
jgi:hypothetical protein